MKRLFVIALLLLSFPAVAEKPPQANAVQWDEETSWPIAMKLRVIESHVEIPSFCFLPDCSDYKSVVLGASASWSGIHGIESERIRIDGLHISLFNVGEWIEVTLTAPDDPATAFGDALAGCAGVFRGRRYLSQHLQIHEPAGGFLEILSETVPACDEYPRGSLFGVTIKGKVRSDPPPPECPYPGYCAKK